MTLKVHGWLDVNTHRLTMLLFFSSVMQMVIYKVRPGPHWCNQFIPKTLNPILMCAFKRTLHVVLLTAATQNWEVGIFFPPTMGDLKFCSKLIYYSWKFMHHLKIFDLTRIFYLHSFCKCNMSLWHETSWKS